MNKMIRIRKEALDFYGMYGTEASPTGAFMPHEEEKNAKHPEKMASGDEQEVMSPKKSSFALASVSNVAS